MIRIAVMVGSVFLLMVGTALASDTSPAANVATSVPALAMSMDNANLDDPDSADEERNGQWKCTVKWGNRMFVGTGRSKPEAVSKAMRSCTSIAPNPNACKLQTCTGGGH